MRRPYAHLTANRHLIIFKYDELIHFQRDHLAILAREKKCLQSKPKRSKTSSLKQHSEQIVWCSTVALSAGNVHRQLPRIRWQCEAFTSLTACLAAFVPVVFAVVVSVTEPVRTNAASTWRITATVHRPSRTVHIRWTNQHPGCQ